MFQKLVRTLDAEIPTEGHGVRPKPGGTEVGRVVSLSQQDYIVKSSSSLSLLIKIFKKRLKDDAKKVNLFIGFIVGNYKRITGDKDAGGLLNEALKAAFEKVYLSEPLGKQLQESLADPKYNPTTADVDALYEALIAIDPRLQPVLAIPAFQDFVAATLGQALNNNAFEDQYGADAAEGCVFIHADTQQVLSGSRFLSHAIPFNNFLLGPDLQQDKPIVGLASAILFRLMMGESADIGPDNMLLVDRDTHFIGVNIDITAFRYERQNPFPVTDRAGELTGEVRLGWESILSETDEVTLIDSLLDRSVFNLRFLEELSKDDREAKWGQIRTYLADQLKGHALEECGALRQWFAGLGARGVIDMLEVRTRELNQSLPECRQVNEITLTKIIRRNQDFLTQPMQAIEASRVVESAAALGGNLAMFPERSVVPSAQGKRVGLGRGSPS